MTFNKDPKKQKNTKWLALINIPIQMGIIIFAFSYLGSWLDEKFTKESSIFTIILSLFSVFLALYNVIRQVKDLNNK